MKYSLRQATEADQEFLFNVVHIAMTPVRLANDSTKVVDFEKGLTEYKEKYPAEKVQVIQYEGKDVGRLRVERTNEKIYIGGIQLLPEYQGKGVGNAIMKDLIKEAEDLGRSITLEVHDSNVLAKSFYEKLGFKFIEQVKNQSILKYSPIDQADK